MGKINVLDFEIANLIAAGEVVERPSSVLKELIENSIDSGATSIVAEIKRGGVALIRVSDDGCGMEADDLPVAIKRHATSKIRSREDLDGIVTLGFRGEALAAISSVSAVTIITKTKNAECGSMLTSEGGKILDVSEVGCADGTTVVVENLFFNVPARRKFLKKDATEAMNCAALVEKVALSRPDISIQLLVDGEEKFKTPGDNNLKNTIYAVYGKDFASKLIEADGTANGIRVHGFIGRSDNTKKNRNYQNIFINGRYVKSLTAQTALEKAFTSYIAPECFPTCALFIEMNPSIVDVNVHPAKLEVKFSDERRVFEAVYYTVKSAIEKEEYRPQMNLGAKKTEYNPASAFVPIGADTKGEQINWSRIATSPLGKGVTETAQRRETYRFSSDSAPRDKREFDLDKPVRFSSGVKSDDAFGKCASPAQLSPKESLTLLDEFRKSRAEEKKEPIIAAEAASTYKTEEDAVPTYKFVGEAFDCYVIIEQDGELLIIDKHAAHERVIFEDLKKNNEGDGRVFSQQLLLPITVLLSPEELVAVKDNISDFEAVGFSVSVGVGSVDILAIPDAVTAADAETLVANMASDIVSGMGNPEITDKIRREKALYQIACKAAIKGGRIYDRSVLDWLIKKVLTLPDITVCPHGRPIAYKLRKSELDRQFNRIK